MVDIWNDADQSDINDALRIAGKPDNLVSEWDVAGVPAEKASPLAGQTLNSYSPSTESTPQTWQERLPGVLYNRFVQPFVSAVTAPGRVYRGEVAPEDMVSEAQNMASAITLGSFPLAGLGEQNALHMGFGPKPEENALQLAKRELSTDRPNVDTVAGPRLGPIIKNDPMLRGSMNPLDEVPFTYKGKNPYEWTPEEFKEVGDKFGVSNLGPLSPLETFKNQEGKEFTIPGGLNGKFTYYDLLQMKAQGIDPSKIDRDLHTKLQQKIMKTMTPDDLTDQHIWSGLVFGITSPNNPLFPNQLAQSRLRLRDPQMLNELSDMIPWKAGEQVDPDLRKQYSDQIANTFGLGAGAKGGLGVRGSQDYTRVAEMAQMFKQDPNFFRKSPNESWPQFVERVSSQVSGLSMKTGSFGSVWQDPANAAISAIDRHMAQQFERTGGLFDNELDRMNWEKRVVDRWNKANPDRQVDNFSELRGMPGTEGHIGGMLLEYVGDAKTSKFRTIANRKTGEMQINPDLPEHLTQTNWVVEPQTVFKMGDAYKRALDINDAIAQQHGLALFPSQWMEWDRIRHRLEPHENMFPGLENIPAMNRDQLRVVNQEHNLSGHKNYTKVDALGRPLSESTEEDLAADVYLQPTKPRSNPARFAHFGFIPAAPLAGYAVNKMYGNENE